MKKILLSVLLTLGVQNSALAEMAMPVYGINEETKECAEFFMGDECLYCHLPDGWEEIEEYECPAGYKEVQANSECNTSKEEFCCTAYHSGASGNCEDVIVNELEKKCTFVDDINNCEKLPQNWVKAADDAEWGIVCPSPDYEWEEEFLKCKDSFSDVKNDHMNFEAIEYFKEGGILQGYGDGTYKPEIKINRAEFLKIIVESNIDSNLIKGEKCFSDVKNDWYAKYVCTAKSQGIINGYPDGSFKPSQNISFVEATKIISNSFNLPLKQDEIWYKPFVENLGERQAIPTSIETFEQAITRGEMAEMIWRLKGNVRDRDFKVYSDFLDEDEISECRDCGTSGWELMKKTCGQDVTQPHFINRLNKAT